MGRGAYAAGAKERALVNQLTGKLRVRPEELPEQIDSLLAKIKHAEKELASLRSEKLTSSLGSLVENRRQINGVSVIAHDFGPGADANEARQMATQLRERLGAEPSVVAVTATAKGRPSIVVTTNEAARERGVSAGALVSIAAKILGGGGGGKPDMAQGGGTDASKVGEALEAIVAQIN